jgi:hypothetical protein
VLGFCLGRRGSRYTQIGPVAADTLEVACDLFLAALRNCAGRQVIVDTTFHQPGWNQFLRELGFVEQRPFMRMVLGDFPLTTRHSSQLAIAGPEVG